MPTGSPARGAPDEAGLPSQAPPPGRRALLLGRSTLAPFVLAATTVAALMGAVLALLPAALRGRPKGRLGPRRADDGTESDTASEPLVP